MAGEGTWRVNADTGLVAFTPVVGFSGNPTVVEYRAATGTTGITVQSTLTVTYVGAPTTTTTTTTAAPNVPTTTPRVNSPASPIPAAAPAPVDRLAETGPEEVKALFSLAILILASGVVFLTDTRRKADAKS